MRADLKSRIELQIREMASQLSREALIQSEVETYVSANKANGIDEDLEWLPRSLDFGQVGSAVLMCQFHAFTGEAQFEAATAHFLESALQKYDYRPHQPFSLYLPWSLTSLAIGLDYLTEYFDYYSHLSLEANSELLELLHMRPPAGTTLNDLEFMTGLAGLLRVVIRLNERDQRFSEDIDRIAGEIGAKIEECGGLLSAEDGRLYLGVAHGLSGILAAVSNVCGDKAKGIGDEILRLLRSHFRTDETGLDLPSYVDFAQNTAPQIHQFGSWCHSGLATSWVLYKYALKHSDAQSVDEALHLYATYVRRFRAGIRGRNQHFCHGLASIVYISHLFETSQHAAYVEPIFELAADELIRKADQKLPFYYQQITGLGTFFNNPGSLNGAGSIAAVFLETTSDIKRFWEVVWAL